MLVIFLNITRGSTEYSANTHLCEGKSKINIPYPMCHFNIHYDRYGPDAYNIGFELPLAISGNLSCLVGKTMP